MSNEYVPYQRLLPPQKGVPAVALGQRTGRTKYHLELTEQERLLLEQIDLRVHHANDEEAHTACNANREPILALVKSLSERRAVPAVRLRYWSDPTYNPGRIKASRKGIFERNGCHREEIYTHPNFVPHLRYFLFGADLPEPVIAAFEEAVRYPRCFPFDADLPKPVMAAFERALRYPLSVRSSDIPPLGKLARRLTEEYGLDKEHASAEFFKLCLDMGIGLSPAGIVAAASRQMR